MDYQTVEVPFLTIGNRQVLTAEQAKEMPWVKEFIDHFSGCFEYDYMRDYWIYYPTGDAPHD